MEEVDLWRDLTKTKILRAENERERVREGCFIAFERG